MVYRWPRIAGLLATAKLDALSISAVFFFCSRTSKRIGQSGYAAVTRSVADRCMPFRPMANSWTWKHAGYFPSPWEPRVTDGAEHRTISRQVPIQSLCRWPCRTRQREAWGAIVLRTSGALTSARPIRSVRLIETSDIPRLDDGARSSRSYAENLAGSP